MITPKEKAKELVDKFKPNAYIGACEDNDELMELYHSKQCALICCNEVLGYMGADRGYEFWTNVKQEIEKL